MGNKKQKWTSEEEEALKAGVAKYGTGRWRHIQNDPKFSQHLSSRSNVDLKDKWRNMILSAENQGQKEKSPTTKATVTADAPVEKQEQKEKSLTTKATVTADAPVENQEQKEKSQTTKATITADAPVAVSSPEPSDPQGSPAPVDPSVAGDSVADDSSKNVEDGKNRSTNAAMILEAVSALNEPNGSETGAIIAYLKERHDLPQRFRKKLGSRLRKLVKQEKLEKVQNGYKIKKGSSSTEAPIPKPEDGPATQNPDLISASDTVEEAAETIKEGSSSTKASIPKPKDDPPTQNAELNSACEIVEEAAETIKDGSSSTKEPIPKPEEGRPTQNLTSACQTVEEEAFSASHIIAEAEHRLLAANAAVRHWERVAKMKEDADSLLQLADEMFEQCISGEIVVLPKLSDTTEESDE